MGEQIEVLEDHADLLAHLAQMRLGVGHQAIALAAQAQQLAAHLDGAGFVALQGHEQAQDGRLARAAGPDDGDLLALGDVEVEIVEHTRARHRICAPGGSG